jgi:peptidoglycan L-alanyl-D-glutamate endopeptidase CwlK
MDQITIQRISQAHPSIRQALLQQYKEANNLLGKGARLRFAYVYRTPSEQDALFNKRPKVTNARAWQSIHNFGLSFDIVLLYDNDRNGTFEEASWSMIRDFDKDSKADWMEIVNYFKSKGWFWGGDFKSFKDAPHFELKKPDGKRYTWQELKAKIDANDTIKDSNGIVYPKL